MKTGGNPRIGLFRLVLLASGSVLLACFAGPPQPVDIMPEDMCDRCRMAISERRFAAEFIDREGRAFKFDDLRCLVKGLKGTPDTQSVTVIYVADFEFRRWIPAEQAYFVQSVQLKTPMSGGTVAFKDGSRAEEAAATYQGKVMRFTELQKAF